MVFRGKTTIGLKDLIAALSGRQEVGDYLSECKFFFPLIICLESRVALVMELCKEVPEWLAVKDISSSKGRIIKIIAPLDSYTVQQRLTRKLQQR
jgi:hypothetical protein